jgi:hypothetical protein
MFSFGLVSIATSSLRTYVLFENIGGYTNPTRAAADILMWTSIDAYTAIICACLPSIKALYDRLRTNTKKTSPTNSSGYARGSSGRGGHAVAAGGHSLRKMRFGGGGGGEGASEKAVLGESSTAVSQASQYETELHPSERTQSMDAAMEMHEAGP